MRAHFAGSILCAVGLFQLCTAASGQSPPPATPPPATFASEPYVIKSSSTVAAMNADGTGSRLQTFAVVIQSESALHNLSVLSLVFSSQSEHADFVYVRVVHTDGTTQETPVDGAIEQPAPVTRAAPFYSDLETKQLPVKSMRIGDTLEWQARFTIYHSEAPNQFWGQNTFSNEAVILDEAYELRIPSGLHLTVWTNPRAGAPVSESEAAGQHIYRWRHSNLKPTVGAAAEAAKKAESKRTLTADEELDATEGKLPDFAWTTFPDWAAVGAWYRSVVADRITPDATIKAKVAELTAGKSTDLEKAQAVYNFVSARIRYVGVAFGIGRFQPHTAAEVFANQYGDCKDKHVLLASMLSVLNLHADPVLVGASIRFNSSVPSPASFNHLITRLSLNGKNVWLDATAEAGTWGALLKVIRDQDALAITASGPSLVVHTPVDLPYPQTSTASVVGSLDKDLTSESKVTFTFHDDSELILRSVLRNVSPADYGTLVQQLMGNLGFGGTTSEPEIDHIDDPSQPLQLSFHYHRVKEKDWGDNRITAIFQPITLPYYTDDQPPTSSIQLGSPRTESSSVSMQLPEGWSAELPAAVHAHALFATCDVTYTFFKDHTLSAERRLVVLQAKVPLADAKQYQSWYDECGANSVPYIQLFPSPKSVAASTIAEPNAPDAPTRPASTATPSDPKAADLIQQAQQSARSMDLDNARKLLDQAAAINPAQLGLWSAYAGVAEMLGMNNQVWDDMQRELTYHPEEVQIYPSLVQAQLARNDSQAALVTLRAWVKAAPGNPDATLALTRQLLDLKQFSDALNAARTAIDRSGFPASDITDLKIIAAKAEVGLGQTSRAANSVAPLLKTATDSVQINDIAHILAEGSAFLTEAEAAEAKVIADSETATADLVIADNSRVTMDQQTRIFAAWDTMALILFHQGKFSRAYGYANAAFHATYAKDVRDHLAAINAQLHVPATTTALRAEEQEVRTIPLGSSDGHQGVTFITMLLADGMVIDSNPEESGSIAQLSDPEKYLKAADVKALFPPGSKARLIRTGYVNCHSGICELVLTPFGGPQSISLIPTQSKIARPVRNLPRTH